MFGRKDEGQETQQQATTQSPLAHRDQTTRSAASPVPARRPVEIPTARRNKNQDSSNESGERKLTVGRGLSLSGEITACDILVVEGKVEAKLSDGKLLEITESGQFRGSVEIENADIAGRYDGQLTVHGRLTLRGTGRISGMVKYGELEVNAGGQIIGEMQVVGGGAGAQQQQGSPNFKNAAKFTALVDEDAEEMTNNRKAANA